MEPRFRLIVHEHLAHQLVMNPDLNAELVTTERVQEKPLRLGLAEASVAVAFLGGIATLSKTCFEIADQVIKWMKERKQPRVTILIEGPRNDALVVIDEKWDSADVAEKIRQTVTED
jgi:hypothetical protein